HLRVVLAAPQRLDPLRGGEVLTGAFGTRNLAVGDVADEQVPERILVLAGDATRPLAADELLPLELVQAHDESRSVRAVERRERAGPEALPDDGRVLEQGLLRRLEQVEPRRDQPLDRLGDLARGAADAEHARELLGVERVAARAAEQLGLRLCRQQRPEQRVEQPRGVVVGQRRERDRQGVGLTAAPPRPAREQLRARRRDDEERYAG